jgi:RNA polymerase sigma factor (sigma-70 family)
MDEHVARYLGRLYEEHHSGLYRNLVFSGATATEAEDLIQEAFLRLFRYLQNSHAVEKPYSWLLSVVHNLRIDGIRKRKREFELDRPEFEGLVERLRTEAPDAETQVILREKHARLQRAISKLAPRQYQYLLLRAEGLKLREIAEIFHVTVQTVSESCAKAMLELGSVADES